MVAIILVRASDSCSSSSASWCSFIAERADRVSDPSPADFESRRTIVENPSSIDIGSEAIHHGGYFVNLSYKDTTS